MSRQCFICNTPIGNANAAKEHIIPNFLGGKIVTKAYLCKTHNGRLSRVDDTLKPLELLANMMDVDRDRGNPPPIDYTMVDKNGEKIILTRSHDGTFFYKDVNSVEGDDQFVYTIKLLSNNPKDRDKILVDIKKKFKEDTAKFGWTEKKLMNNGKYSGVKLKKKPDILILKCIRTFNFLKTCIGGF